MYGLYLAQQLINALSYGSILALLAIGYTMIYGILGLINFAHGEIFMIGAFFFYLLVTFSGVPFLVGFFAAIAGSIFIGLLIERFVYKPCLKRSPEVLTVFIASFGASLGLRNLFTMIFGDGRRAFPSAEFLEGIIITKAGLFINVKDLWILVVTVILLVAVTLFIKHTKLGTAMRAVAYDANAARLVGVNSTTVVLLAFVIGSALAGVSAVSYGVSYGIVNPSMGYLIGLNGFIAAVLGGIGNVPGAAAAGYIIGLGEVMFVALLPPSYSAVRPIFVWALLFLILFIKPSGLFRPSVKIE
ncbi:MAG: branched-chain amino acid ABC transporter permease [Aminobacterium colombiense]|jgi:branched-chain amino acid transport system permease protein|nr:branched-chain amino acid ABC transporter permease [Aminobacterium colombiense]MDD3768900.1 branched-chain amino acid ABC transporter permease [Aminobacterium colombiense]MDD4266042.1 branched-chain amino acid ABC transporter permease [Aminobacterium colombiense]MDD4586560.1 branched-chain amino acid ABC transporter permease [Aminobacterium colombiense]